MNKGYLVSFEGQDASGKSALLHRVDNQLRKRGYKTKVVEEFSASEMGESLRKKLTQDKFLRFGEPLPTAFAETMRVVADLYYQDELEISPAIAEGKVVLKERHIDTIFACQIPKIRCDYPEANFADLWTWVKELTRNLYRKQARKLPLSSVEMNCRIHMRSRGFNPTPYSRGSSRFQAWGQSSIFNCQSSIHSHTTLDFFVVPAKNCPGCKDKR